MQMWDVPRDWTLKDAATVPVAYMTAYYALLIRGGLQPHHKVLVHSGTGAVGMAAIRICRHRGCEVSLAQQVSSLSMQLADDSNCQNLPRICMIIRAPPSVQDNLQKASSREKANTGCTTTHASPCRTCRSSRPVERQKKRDYLQQTFPFLDDDHIGDSRSHILRGPHQGAGQQLPLP